MGFSISEVVESSRYKNFMKYLYGWGAAIVLVGALFKLQHWPGAGIMLTVGMLTEAVIFFFSAFEPIVEEVDWSLVYPELSGVDSPEAKSRRSGGSNLDAVTLENVISSALSKSSLNVGSISGDVQLNAKGAPAGQVAAAPVAAGAGMGGMVFSEKFNEMLEKAEVTPDLFVKVRQGLEKLGSASTDIASITRAISAGENFSTNMNRAASAVERFSSSYENSGQLMARSAEVLTQDFAKTTKQIQAVGEEITKTMSEGVTQLSSKLNAACESVITPISESGKQLQGLSKNIDALNAAYEIQVKNIQGRITESDKLSAGVEEMMKNLQQAVADSQRYGQSVAQLTNHVSQLNTIYGNMLSAMGSVMGR